MPPIPSMQELENAFATRGAFTAINDYVENGAISPALASHWTAQIFELFAAKAGEAQKEVRHLDAVIRRVAHVAARGSRPHPYQPRDPLILSLAHEITTFDNWVISLYETDLTMIWYAAPERAQAKPLEMAKSMEALRQKRLAQHDWGLNDPSLFKLG